MKNTAAIIVIFVSISIFFQSQAQADIQVYPTYILLQGKSKSSHLTVQNNSNKKEKLSVKTVFFRMKEDGSYERTEPIASEKKLLERLKFSPKEITLEPNAKQVVRLFLTESTGGASDSYAHVLFEPTQESSTENSEKESQKIQMSMEARMAVAVPVVYRPQKANRKPVLKNLAVSNSKDGIKISAAVENQNKESFLFGDVALKYSDDSGKSEEILTLKGLSSYLPYRTWQHTIKDPEQIQKISKLKKGHWTLIYKSSEGDPDTFETSTDKKIE